MAWDNNAERKEHTRESAEVTISLDKEELEKIAAFLFQTTCTMKFRIPCLIMLHIWKKNLHHR